MNDILTKLFTEAEPDVLSFQEVIDDMFGILQMRTRPVGDMHDWTLHKRKDADTSYYVVTATKLIKEEGDRSTPRLFDFNQGRRALTLTRQGMQFINVHAESGGSQDSRDARASQLQYLARAHESTARGACVLAGDFNLRQGEDRVLLEEGWHDAACKVIDVDSEGGDDWTWAHGTFRARYDRAYIHAGARESLECVRCSTLPGYMEAHLSDHKALFVELRRERASEGAAVAQSSMPAAGCHFIRVMNAAVWHVQPSDHR
jgi:endonuclease/exonuclease/phosphatase family metal-dependent hydrolase